MLRCLLFLGLLSAIAVCRAWPEDPGTGRADPAVAALARGNTAFALDLYGRLRGAPGNLFLSPHSVSTALAMTYAGARGATAEQMAATLRLPAPGTAAHDAFAALLAATGGPAGLRVANGLFGQQGLGFSKDFLETVRSRYRGGLAEVDFAGDLEGARRTINAWIAKETAGKIPELLKADDLTTATSLVLANAVHFKDAWSGPFDPAQTAPAAFTLASGESVQVPTMSRSGACRVGSGPGVTLLELPYGKGERAMLFLIPAAHDGLPALEAALDPKTLERWTSGLAEDERPVCVPRFKLESRFELSPPLQAMGMKDAFGPGADFSGMTGKPELFIGRVIHQAVVEVNEEGTEAAAATAVAMERGGPPPVVRVDRPFLFLIRDTRTGTVLFLGRVADPR